MTETDADRGGSERGLFVSMAETSWWKFKLAAVVWELTSGNSLLGVGYLPGAHKAAMWAFEIRVLSRDFEQCDRDTDAD